MPGSSSKKKKNKILWAALILSILVHGVIFSQMTGIFHESTFIELTLKEELRPLVSNVPEATRLDTKEPEAKIVAPQIKKFTEPPAIPPVPLPLPETKSILTAHKKPASPPPPLPASPKPVQKTSSSYNKPGAQSGAAGSDNVRFDSAGDYFQMIRMRIEKNKKYPPNARRQNITGRVTVKFIIQTDGRVSNLKLVKRSEFNILNRAAFEAIKNSIPFPIPPPAYFKSDLPVQLSIVFDLD